MPSTTGSTSPTTLPSALSPRRLSCSATSIAPTLYPTNASHFKPSLLTGSSVSHCLPTDVDDISIRPLQHSNTWPRSSKASKASINRRPVCSSAAMRSLFSVAETATLSHDQRANVEVDEEVNTVIDDQGDDESSRLPAVTEVYHEFRPFGLDAEGWSQYWRLSK